MREYTRFMLFISGITTIGISAGIYNIWALDYSYRGDNSPLVVALLFAILGLSMVMASFHESR